MTERKFWEKTHRLSSVDLLCTSLFASIVGILLAFFVSIGGGFWGLLVSSSRVTRTFVMGCRTFVVIRYDFSFFSEMGPIKVNLCQKHSFLHQLTHNMTTDCSLNYEFSTRKLQVQYMFEHQIVFCFCFDMYLQQFVFNVQWGSLLT